MLHSQGSPHRPPLGFPHPHKRKMDPSVAVKRKPGLRSSSAGAVGPPCAIVPATSCLQATGSTPLLIIGLRASRARVSNRYSSDRLAIVQQTARLGLQDTIYTALLSLLHEPVKRSSTPAAHLLKVVSCSASLTLVYVRSDCSTTLCTGTALTSAMYASRMVSGLCLSSRKAAKAANGTYSDEE